MPSITFHDVDITNMSIVGVKMILTFDYLGTKIEIREDFLLPGLIMSSTFAICRAAPSRITKTTREHS